MNIDKSKLKNKSVLITGGTGSFDSTIIKDLLTTDIYTIKVLSRNEKKQKDLRFKFNDDRIKFFIGDVMDYDSTTRAVKNSNFVFHAGLLKLSTYGGDKSMSKLQSSDIYYSDNTNRLSDHELDTLLLTLNVVKGYL